MLGAVLNRGLLFCLIPLLNLLLNCFLVLLLFLPNKKQKPKMLCDLENELRLMQDAVGRVKEGHPEAVQISKLVFNLKRRDPEGADALVRFLRGSQSPFLQHMSKAGKEIKCVEEEPGEVIGPGSAIVNVLLACDLDSTGLLNYPPPPLHPQDFT